MGSPPLPSAVYFWGSCGVLGQHSTQTCYPADLVGFGSVAQVPRFIQTFEPVADCLFVRLSFNSFHLQAVCLQRLWHPAAANPAPHHAVSDCYGRDFLWGVVDVCLVPVPPL